MWSQDTIVVVTCCITSSQDPICWLLRLLWYNEESKQAQKWYMFVVDIISKKIFFSIF